jgi:16S rRNA (adenine1518-N6/adenine1519-N6)-dimethyltransferase
LPQLEVEESGFIEFLKLSFGQKRKTLVNNLRARYEPEQIKRAMKTANVKPDARSEAISLEKMAALFKALSATLPT